jgi:hypothetical protein
VTQLPEEVDPSVAEMVVQIRDRFGIRGLRGAAWLIQNEIRLAEDALKQLPEE